MYLRPKKMFVSCNMPKTVRVGRSAFLLLFFFAKGNCIGKIGGEINSNIDDFGHSCKHLGLLGRPLKRQVYLKLSVATTFFFLGRKRLFMLSFFGSKKGEGGRKTNPSVRS